MTRFTRQAFVDIYKILLRAGWEASISADEAVDPVEHNYSFDYVHNRHNIDFTRIFDLVVTVVILIPAIIIIGVAVFLIKGTSRGPAIYTQVRVGRGGRLFVIYKLRTMRNNVEQLTGPRWADMRRDPRVTRIGEVLRRTHIDELPKLVNVLRGDMSIIGPSPERPEFVVQLELAIPHYQSRLQIRPGVTGLAQLVLPPDADVVSVANKLMYDLYYIKNRSLYLDMKILFGTVLKVIEVPRNVIARFLGLPAHQEIVTIYQNISDIPTGTVDRSRMEEVNRLVFSASSHS